MNIKIKKNNLEYTLMVRVSSSISRMNKIINSIYKQKTKMPRQDYYSILANSIYIHTYSTYCDFLSLLNYIII